MKCQVLYLAVQLLEYAQRTYLSISCCQLSWLRLQYLVQQGQDACLVQPQRHWNSIQGDSVPQVGVRSDCMDSIWLAPTRRTKAAKGMYLPLRLTSSRSSKLISFWVPWRPMQYEDNTLAI
ncbi:MAG: hypothetical protein FRX49_01707 [Trebouxia sp. A1-2]|nr:MAG: hypothetical protein FRX49_01707 [Trebouxia sp. A1-2]